MKLKRFYSMIISTILAVGLVICLPSNINAASSSNIVGKDRYETANKISQSGWHSSDNVIVVNSKAVSDAMSVAPLAKALNAPVLLSKSDGLDSNTLKEIERLGAKNVYLIGGDNVLSKEIEKSLTSKGLSLERIGGNNRETTALAIAEKLATLVPITDVIIINGTYGLADAASIIAVAAKLNIPILFTNSRSDLDSSLSFINSHNINKSYIIGNSSTLSDSLESILPNPERISGENRNDISAKILEKFYKDIYMNGIYVVKDGSLGDDQLIDSAIISVLAGLNGFPVITVGDKLSIEQFEYLNGKYFDNIVQVGGSGNETVFDDIISITENNKPQYVTSTTSPSYITTSPNYITTTPSYITTSPNYVTTTPSYITTSPNYVTTVPSHNTTGPSHNHILTPDMTTEPSYTTSADYMDSVHNLIVNILN